MAKFLLAYEKTIVNEGGYRLHRIKGDRGGLTYAGIARNFHPNWPGWNIIDLVLMLTEDNQYSSHIKIDLDIAENEKLNEYVRTFYNTTFWNRMKGDDIINQKVAESVFDFSVNTGIKVCSKLVQLVVGSTPDGVIGPITINKLNNYDTERFIERFTLAKIIRYTGLCNRDRQYSKFLLGWNNRSLKDVSI